MLNFESKLNGNRWNHEWAQNIRCIHDLFVELFDRHVINISRLRTDFSVTGSDKGVKFPWEQTIQISDCRLLLGTGVIRPIAGECDSGLRVWIKWYQVGERLEYLTNKSAKPYGLLGGVCSGHIFWFSGGERDDFLFLGRPGNGSWKVNCRFRTPR